MTSPERGGAGLPATGSTEGEDGRSDPAGPLERWEGKPVTRWERSWNVPDFEAWRRLPSTNDRLRDLAGEGARPFTVVTAEEQTAGRGRHGSRWASAPGKGLWVSVLLPAPGGQEAGTSPLLVGIAVCRAIRRELPDLTPQIKWPNDVLLDGRKVCGILLQRVEEDRVVAGIGLNVRHCRGDFPRELQGRAVSLEAASGERVSRPGVMEELLAALSSFPWRRPVFLSGNLGRELESLDALRGRTVRSSTGVRGTARGIDPRGRLRIEGPDGWHHRLAVGSVRTASERAELPEDPNG